MRAKVCISQWRCISVKWVLYTLRCAYVRRFIDDKRQNGDVGKGLPVDSQQAESVVATRSPSATTAFNMSTDNVVSAMKDGIQLAASN